MPSNSSDNVFVYAPIGRDGPASVEMLRRAGIKAETCRDLPELLTQMETGAAAIFVAEEGLFGDGAIKVTAWVDRQPAWSDLPFIVLTSHQAPPGIAAWRTRLVAGLRNVSLLERPVQPITLTSTMRAALRARERQYEVRALLEARERAAQELEHLVTERTRALEEANDQLRTQMAERMSVEAALRQSQKLEAIGQLTGGVAHDFNNLLMVISGGLEMLKRNTDQSRRQRLMNGMQLATKRGEALTKQLLAFSRRQELKPETIDLARQIGQMRELLDRSLRGDVQVNFEFPGDLWAVDADPGELELVVLNLAVNARDAMPTGGTITVRGENLADLDDGELVGDYVCLSVSDTGTGMAPGVKERALEPFFTTKEIGKGSGLGLAQAHGFSKQSGGTLRIDSEAGCGTTISVFLPRSDHMAPSRAQHNLDAEIERRPPGSAGCVLLVEDDDEVAALVSEMLDQLGYEVTRAASAAAALGALANGRRIDVVFSDIMMPGDMNGIELAGKIRTRRRGLPILLTSGYAEIAKRDADTESVLILKKPYRLDELAEALRNVTASA